MTFTKPPLIRPEVQQEIDSMRRGAKKVMSSPKLLEEFFAELDAKMPPKAKSVARARR